jgi:hypothetical protein
MSARNRWVRGVVKGVAKRFDLALHTTPMPADDGQVTQFAAL